MVQLTITCCKGPATVTSDIRDKTRVIVRNAVGNREPLQRSRGALRQSPMTRELAWLHSVQLRERTRSSECSRRDGLDWQLLVGFQWWNLQNDEDGAARIAMGIVVSICFLVGSGRREFPIAAQRLVEVD